MRASMLMAAICQVSCLAIRPAVVKPFTPTPTMTTDDASFELIRKYLNTAPVRQAATRGVEMEVDIDARLPKIRKAGALSALRHVSCAGQVTYEALHSSGDVRVTREVIARYLAAESEVRDTGALSITPSNYEFRLKATPRTEGPDVTVFRLKPKKKRVGLFKGELWLDAQTGMPLREAGQFVKVPSLFLKSIRFVRDYEIRDGVSVPKSIESTVESRLMGPVELSVHFHNLEDVK